MHPDVLRAIRTVHETAATMSIDTVLIGALASELCARRENVMEPGRKTEDADFAVRVRDWQEFLVLREGLREAGLKQDTHIEHRLHLGSAMVDLVPHGPGVCSADDTITWPDSQFVMRVVGFDEACGAATVIDVPDMPRLRCVDVAGFVLLKIIAFRDRLARGDKKHKSDADDIWHWLEFYASGGADERRFGVLDIVRTSTTIMPAPRCSATRWADLPAKPPERRSVASSKSSPWSTARWWSAGPDHGWRRTRTRSGEGAA